MKKIIIAIAMAACGFAAAVAQNTTAVVVENLNETGGSVYDPIPPRGYCGMAGVELLATDPYGGTAVGVTTTQGAMVTERHFLGIGAGYLRDLSFDMNIIPIFAEGRLFFQSAHRKIYPNVGLKLGGMIVSEGGTGFYSALTGGVRVPIGPRLGLMVEIGPQITTGYNRKLHNAPFASDGTNIGFFARVGLMF